MDKKEMAWGALAVGALLLVWAYSSCRLNSYLPAKMQNPKCHPLGRANFVGAIGRTPQMGGGVLLYDDNGRGHSYYFNRGLWV